MNYLATSQLAGLGLDGLTVHKASHIMERDGHKPVGVVMQDAKGNYCIVAQSAVRWLDRMAFFHMMHGQKQEDRPNG